MAIPINQKHQIPQNLERKYNILLRVKMEHFNKLLSRSVQMKLHMEGPTSALPV